MRCRITYCFWAGLIGDVLTCGLREEGRRDWEVDLRYGVKKNHMITLESIEFRIVNSDIYIIPLYVYIYLES